jgi:RNA polymerase sigma-70 factor (ECF subfamily)
MTDHDHLAEAFEQHRPHLRAVALRMLGSTAEADDAVQEAWIRLSRSDTAAVDNLGGWLTTVTARVALDRLRSRRRRPDVSTDAEAVATIAAPDDPAADAELADSLGTALLVVLDALAPAERVAFVLHDTFAVPFEEIGAVLNRSPEAAKQLAHRARRKVQGADPAGEADPVRRRAVVDAFLAASRKGEFEALVALLHPDIVLRADAVAVGMGSPEALQGAPAVAGMFSGRAQGATPAVVDGNIGMVWMVGGRPRVVWDFTVVDDVVVAIDMIADPDEIGRLDVIELA